MDSPKSSGASPIQKAGSDLTIGPTAKPRTCCSNDSVNVLVDSGAPGHYFDDAIIPGFRDRQQEYKVLDVPRNVSTAGGGGENGTAQGLLRGHVVDDKGVRRLIQISCLIVPGLRRNLFSVKQAERNDVVSILDMTNPMLEIHNHTFPFQELGHDLLSFTLNLAGGGNGPELAMMAAANANLWHRRLGYLNRKSLSLLKNLDNSGVGFDGPVPDCDVYAVRKSHQLAHPKTANNKVKLPFQLVLADLMGPLTPEALGGYKNITNISDEYTKWTEPYLLKSKHNALSSFQVIVRSVVIPSGFRVERLRVDKERKFSSKEFPDYCLQTGVSLEYATTNTPQQIGMSGHDGRTLAATVRCMLADSGLPEFLWDN